MSNIKELIREKIDAFYAEYKAKFHQNGDSYHLGIIDGLDIAERILDTLPDEPVTDCHELTEAAETHVKNKYCLTKLLGAEIQEAVNDFIAGAEWQKAKMFKDNPVIMSVEDFQALIDSHAKRAEADYKEKMMKDAVEAMVTTNLANHPVIYLDQLKGFQYGDKVKIIIVKEEE